MTPRIPDPTTDPPENCRTGKDLLPNSGEIAADNAEPHFLLAAYTDDAPELLGNVFLQRLRIPMTVYSEKARTEITLPTLAAIHRWASTEFQQYEMGEL